MNKPSRKGKKNKFQNRHYLKDMYNFYISDKEKNSSYYVDSKLYRQILNDYISYIIESVLDGSIFYMPSGLGSIYVFKKKVSPGYGMQPDWELSRKIDKVVYHLNEHSNGYKYNFKWDKLPCRFRNHRMYRLTMMRGVKRALAKYIKKLGTDYIEE
jgi:hypothetical protein